MSSKLCFQVRCQTELNQFVLICGNIPELGNWNAYQALKLCTSPNLYPVWTCDAMINVEPNTLVEFKVIISDGINYFWESIPNRGARFRHIKQILLITYNLPNLSVRPLQRLISETDLTQLHIGTIRRIKIGDPFFDLDDSDSNTDHESDLQEIGSISSIEEQLTPLKF